MSGVAAVDDPFPCVNAEGPVGLVLSPPHAETPIINATEKIRFTLHHPSPATFYCLKSGLRPEFFIAKQSNRVASMSSTNIR